MEDLDDRDRGLTFDLSTLLTRRRALTLLGGVGLATLVGCGSDSSKTAASTTSSTASSSATSTAPGSTSAAGASCATIPAETAGPFPGDGTNGPDALGASGIVRSDITSSFGSSTTKAEGIPTKIDLVLQQTAQGCAPLQGAAVYVWHCDREGRYSMYSPGATEENYLRGVQETDAEGRVTFASIFPACYPGRWPHVHFEVYSSVDDATSGGRPIATSQLAVPEDTCNVAFATSGYDASVGNLSELSLTTDMVFADDGAVHQLATVTGDAGSGYTLALTVPV